MKLVRREWADARGNIRENLYISGITKTDVKWSNIAGRLQPGEDPSTKPSHYFDLDITDPELLSYLVAAGVNVKETPDYHNPDELNHRVRFKIYPKTSPVIRVITPSTGVVRELQYGTWGEVDALNFTEMKIEFHIFRSDFHGTHFIPSVNILQVEADEGAGETGRAFTNEFFGYSSDDESSLDEGGFV
jgi:hypothetical protein